jgi:hypothetical protein
MSITQTGCIFVAQVTHHAMRMRHSVACPALQYFSTYPIKGMIFEKKLLNIKCVFRDSLQLFYKTFFILSRTEQDMIKNVHLSLCKERSKM